MADPIADIDAGTTKFGVWPSDGLIVQPPAFADDKSEFDTLAESIISLEDATTKCLQAFKVQYGAADDTPRVRHKSNMQKLRMTEDRHANIEGKEASLGLGRVEIGFGYTTSALQSDTSQSQEHCALVWALVDATPSRVGGNLVSNEPSQSAPYLLTDNTIANRSRSRRSRISRQRVLQDWTERRISPRHSKWR